MTTNKKDNFNTEPLVLEIENVLKNGLNKILNEYIYRYDLLEKTHQQIMRLPSVLNELNINPNSYSENEIKDRCESTKKYNIAPEFSIINNKISIIEQKYENVSYTLDIILQKLDTLNADIKMIKETKPVEPKQLDSDQKNNTFIKPSIVSACENENIKFEINDSDDSSCDECEANNYKEDELGVEVKNNKVVRENLLAAGIYAKYLMDREEELEDDKEEDDKEEEEEEVEDDKEEEEVEDDKEEEELEDDKEEVEEVVDDKEEVEEVVDDKEEVEDDKEEVEDDKEEEEVETEKSESEEEEEEEELVEIEIDDITYCTNDEENGFIYELTKDGDVGDKVGYLKEGEPFFYADEK